MSFKLAATPRRSHTSAVRRNIPGGRIDVATHAAAGRAILTIASAHDATITAPARTGGGLRLGVSFPAEATRRVDTG